MRIPLLLLAVLLAAPARSAERGGHADRPWRLSGEYLYYLPSSSRSGLTDQLGALGRSLVDRGLYDSYSQDVTTNGGAGARLALLRRWDSATEIGASVDYVLGPTMNADFRAFNAATGSGGLTIHRSAAYLRLMARSQVRLLGRDRRRQGDWQLEAVSAFGPSVGHIDQACQASGTLTCTVNSKSTNWLGVAWEFGPRVTVRLRDLDVGASVMAAGFPRSPGDADVARINWQTLGLALTAEF